MRATVCAFLKVILGFLWAVPVSHAADTQSDLIIYTEDYKPFYFLNAEGEVDGTITRLVRELADDADISIDLRLRPFKRGLLAVEKTPGTCFMALWRTAIREPNFSWVGPLQVDGFAFFALADSDISMSSLTDSFSYSTGAVAGWTSTVEVERAGHPSLVLVDDDALNLKMLSSGNTKLWLGGLLSAPYLAEQQGIEIKNVYTIQEVDLALACNPDTDRNLTNRLQTALGRHLDQTIKPATENSQKHLVQ